MRPQLRMRICNDSMLFWPYANVLPQRCVDFRVVSAKLNYYFTLRARCAALSRKGPVTVCWCLVSSRLFYLCPHDSPMVPPHSVHPPIPCVPSYPPPAQTFAPLSPHYFLRSPTPLLSPRFIHCRNHPLPQPSTSARQYSPAHRSSSPARTCPPSGRHPRRCSTATALTPLLPVTASSPGHPVEQRPG